jgi:hypothetical protein
MYEKSRSIAFRRLLQCASLILAGMIGCGTNPSASKTNSGAATSLPSAAMSASILGYAWDKSVPGLRPIVGVSGASSLGTPIYGDEKFNSAVISAQRQYALFSNTANRIFLALLPSGQPTALTDGLSSDQRITLSPSGSAAVIYAPDQRRLILVQGLPGSPQLQTIPWPASAAAADEAAVSDSGLVVTGTRIAGGNMVVNSLTASGTAGQIATLSAFGGFAFLPQSTSLLLADAGQNTLFLAAGLPNATTLSPLAGFGQGIRQPLLVAASADGHSATLVNGDASLVRIDLTMKGSPSVVKCNCSPTVMIPLSGNAVFLVSDLSAGPLWMFDGDAATPRVVFIAGLQQSATAGGIK